MDPPWPVTRDSLEKFVALMAKAAYAPGSIVQYVGAVLRQMVLMHHTVEPGLLQWRRYLVQAAKRDGGDAHASRGGRCRRALRNQDLDLPELQRRCH